MLFALLNNKGLLSGPADCSNSRSIIVSDCIAKVSHRSLINKVAPTYQAQLIDTQPGGVVGGGTYVPVEACRLFCQLIKQRGKSGAAFVLDLRAALSLSVETASCRARAQ